ncbi:iron-sulfur protein [Streptomyces sulfonofaciens]|uniref:Cytochrome bc1 complex Rieske iron-sulfur subunit n=1 Tax=Streptomyces sulfonofaciens TaxID=68272 RepID=A0A919GQM5_9ACTN|nr:Rieske (2Fe-2S) protein [Streptomyces sulfonofaciens]GHH88276.1 iron-sulfur protein [Streptomyces sulfonofaciens]
MSLSRESFSSPSRRAVVTAAGAVGLAATLAACGDSGGSGTVSSGSAGSDSAKSPDKGSAAPLAKTADIPEGGGKIFKDQQVVVTQPAKGEFKAFTSTCTHQGCTVSSVSGGTINCPCHGSKFSIEDGSVKHPPATEALAAMKIQVSGDEIKLA